MHLEMFFTNTIRLMMAEWQSHHNTSLMVRNFNYLSQRSLTSLAGYAYCAIGALSLLDRPLDSTSAHSPEKAMEEGIPNRQGLIQFLASRPFAYLPQEEEADEVEENFIESKVGAADYGHIGFNGRWNKKADTCYCWWVGGTLAVSL